MDKDRTTIIYGPTNVGQKIRHNFTHCADIGFSINSVSVAKYVFSCVHVIDTDKRPDSGIEGDHRVLPVILVGSIPAG